MTAHAKRRQYKRYAVDLAVCVTISESSARQIVPIVGPRLDARLRDVSGGGGLVVLATFLPRGALVDLELSGVAGSSPCKLRAQVVSVKMIDREPHYAVGLRFPEDESETADRLGAASDGKLPESRVEGKFHVAMESEAELPKWMAALAAAGVASSDTLSKALSEAGGDEQRAGDGLVSSGIVAQRDLGLAVAESCDLPFVEPGEYRIRLENRDVLREEMARTHIIFPLFSLDGIITLAAARPLDLVVLDQIRLHSGREVDVCVASPRELQHLIEWAYGGFHESAGASATSTEAAWTELLKDVADAPVVKLVDVLLDRAATSRATDIHIDAEESALRVRFRVDGILREVPAPPKSLLPAIVSRIKILSHLNIAETRLPQDGHFKLATDQEELDIRVSTLPSVNGEAVVLRLLRSGSRLLSLEELGMESKCLARFDQLIHLPHGMLLVTGPTGSGKTTTLYSTLSRIDRVRQSILTLEDPVEVRLRQVRQVSVNPKAGLTFQRGLRAFLRQDPDCIMLGEIRDRETADIALQAALTGHLVLSTLHTNSAAAAATRLLDMGVADFLIASALVGVLAQRLCRHVCPHCTRPASTPPEGMETLVEELLDGAPHMEAVGCKRCGHTGYEGRLGVFELLVVSPEVRRAILDHRGDHAVAELARQDGMRTLLEDGIDKVRGGLTTLSELFRVVGHLEQTSLPKAGGRRRGGAYTDRSDSSGFDVADYERLLNQWLRPQADAAPVGTAGRP